MLILDRLPTYGPVRLDVLQAYMTSRTKCTSARLTYSHCRTFRGDDMGCLELDIHRWELNSLGASNRCPRTLWNGSSTVSCDYAASFGAMVRRPRTMARDEYYLINDHNLFNSNGMLNTLRSKKHSPPVPTLGVPQTAYRRGVTRNC